VRLFLDASGSETGCNKAIATMLKLNSKLQLCGSAEKEIKMRNMSKLVKVAIASMHMGQTLLK
jgi:hypothetical protein